MPTIQLHTTIKAPAKRCFDLARSIDLHLISTKHTGEQAIAGRTSGVIELGETVTWRAKHLGITQKLTSKITAFDSPHYFTDEMVAGPFKSFKHEHIFTKEDGVVIMTDVFDYKSPLGFLGSLADALFLERYMTKLLTERNRVVKLFAEDPELYKNLNI